MALLTDEIANVLSTGGLLKIPNTFGEKSRFTDFDRDHIVQDSYTKHKLTVDSGKNAIVLTTVDIKATDYDCVNIQTLDSVSAIGPVSMPGYVYTGNFSGCVYYLYKTGAQEVTGVHAYNGMIEVKKKRFLPFLKPKITKVPHEFGPTSYYTRNPATQLCRYPTRGELKIGAYIGDPSAEEGLNFLSCVERTSATTFLFSTKGTLEGGRVRRLLNTYRANF